MICNCNHLHGNVSGIEEWGKVDVFAEEFCLVFKIKNVFSSFVKISCTGIANVCLFCEIKAELRPNILMEHFHNIYGENFFLFHSIANTAFYTIIPGGYTNTNFKYYILAE